MRHSAPPPSSEARSGGGRQEGIEALLDGCLLSPADMRHFCAAVDADAVALDLAATPPHLVPLA